MAMHTLSKTNKQRRNTVNNDNYGIAYLIKDKQTRGNTVNSDNYGIAYPIKDKQTAREYRK